jgi:tetratricopeptide (TPR) repeat protein
LETIKYSDEAIAKDPHLTRAYIKKAYGGRFVAKVRNRNWVEALNESDKLARKAIEIDPYDASAHILLGMTMMETGNRKQSAVEIDRALKPNPSSADIIMLADYEMAYFGRPEEGALLCDRGFRLNPMPPPWYPTSCEEDYFFTKRYAESVDMVERALDWRPKDPYCLVSLQRDKSSSVQLMMQPYFFKSLRINLSAARLFLLVWTSTSRTSPSASTARHR